MDDDLARMSAFPASLQTSRRAHREMLKEAILRPPDAWTVGRHHRNIPLHMRLVIKLHGSCAVRVDLQ